MTVLLATLRKLALDRRISNAYPLRKLTAPAVANAANPAAVRLRVTPSGPSAAIETLPVGDRAVPLTSRLDASAPTRQPTLPAFRLLNEDGSLRGGENAAALLEAVFGQAEAVRSMVLNAYRTMLRVHTMDAILYEAQRQGRISFYMSSFGEEASTVGSAMALAPGDQVLSQYREQGVYMYRGFSLAQVAAQCFATNEDEGRGRMMPVHYTFKAGNCHTVSSPLATQIPQAAGAAYALKLQTLQAAGALDGFGTAGAPAAAGHTPATSTHPGPGHVTACYFGEGAASEGDFHAGLNIAATTGAPVVFFCRVNQWAISTPSTEQYRGDGIAPRAIALGMHALRVDGNDLFAVYAATAFARAIALGRTDVSEALSDGDLMRAAALLHAPPPPPGSPEAIAAAQAQAPVLVEALTYRESHHSTSDDSTRYRPVDEVRAWRETKNPLRRLRAFMEARGWWSAAEEEAAVAAEKAAVMDAIAHAETHGGHPPVEELFQDVYAPVTPATSVGSAEAVQDAAAGGLAQVAPRHARRSRGAAGLPQHLAQQWVGLQQHMELYPGVYDKPTGH